MNQRLGADDDERYAFQKTALKAILGNPAFAALTPAEVTAKATSMADAMFAGTRYVMTPQQRWNAKHSVERGGRA